jgi:hypothetical protein
MKGEFYNPEVQPGTRPPCRYRTEKQGGREFYVIDDNRTPFASGMFSQMGIPLTAYDVQKKTLRLEASAASQFEAVKDIISNIPYFEVNRSQARFAADDLKGMGCQAMVRPRWSNNLDGEANDFLFMAPDEATWAKATAKALEKSRATSEQVKALTEARNNGSIDDDLIHEDLNVDVDTFFAQLAAGEVSIPHAEKAINTFAPAEPKSIKSLKDLIAEGRLNEMNSPVPLDNIDGITKRDFYKLRDIGQKAASAIERAEVKYLLDNEYHSKKIPANLDELKSSDARAFKREIASMLTPEQRDGLTQAARSAKAGIANGTVAKVAHNAKEDSLGYINEIASNLNGQRVDIGTGMVALEVQGATPNHIIGYTDPEHTRYAVIETNGASDELRSRLDALSNDGSGKALADRFLVASNQKGRNAVLMPTSQESHAAAAAEAVGIATARNSLGKGDKLVVLGPDQTPEAGKGMVVSMGEQPYVAVLDENTLMTVPAESIKGKAAFFQPVTFTQNGSNDGLEPALAVAAPAGPKKARTR